MNLLVFLFLFLSLMMLIQPQSGSVCDINKCKKLEECPLLQNEKPKRLSKKLCGPSKYCCVESATPRPTTSTPIPLPNKKCGVSNVNDLPFISGGKECQLGQYPWMAAIYYRNQPEMGCGGTLISKEWILTAAHCIPDEIKSAVEYVRLGDLDLNDSDDGAQPINVTVKKSHKHPNYSEGTGSNDIGLLHLKEAVNLTTQIGHICLHEGKNEAQYYQNPKEVSVAGWGELQSTHKTSKLMYAKMDVTECGKNRPKPIDSKIMLCAYQSGSDACKGDSGGPLMFYDSIDEKYYQIGIVSFGDNLNCGHSMEPGVYTKVAAFIPWITEITGLKF